MQREFALGTWPQNRHVGHHSARGKVDDRRLCPGGTFAVGLQVPKTSWTDDGDVDGHREHVVVGTVFVDVGKRRETAEASNLYIESRDGVGGHRRLGTQRGDVEGRRACVEDALGLEGVIFATGTERAPDGLHDGRLAGPDVHCDHRDCHCERCSNCSARGLSKHRSHHGADRNLFVT